MNYQKITGKEEGPGCWKGAETTFLDRFKKLIWVMHPEWSVGKTILCQQFYGFIKPGIWFYFTTLPTD